MTRVCAVLGTTLATALALTVWFVCRQQAAQSGGEVAFRGVLPRAAAPASTDAGPAARKRFDPALLDPDPRGELAVYLVGGEPDLDAHAGGIPEMPGEASDEGQESVAEPQAAGEGAKSQAAADNPLAEENPFGEARDPFAPEPSMPQAAPEARLVGDPFRSRPTAQVTVVAGPDDDDASAKPQAAGERLERALRQRLGVRFVEAPAGDALEALRHAARAPLIVDTDVSEPEPFDRPRRPPRPAAPLEKPVTLSLRDAPLAAVLDAVAEQTGLDWSANDGAAIVTTRDRIWRYLVTEIYPVGDLVVPSEADGPFWDDSDALVEAVCGLCGGGNWDDFGGDGSAAAMPLGGTTVLVVTQSRRVQRQVAAFLAELRAIQANKSLPLPSSAARERLDAALRRKVRVEHYVPLDETLRSLGRQAGVVVILDRAALDQAGIDPASPVPVAIEGVSLRSTLRLLLANLDLAFVARVPRAGDDDSVADPGPSILVTTPEEAEEIEELRLYPVADLVEWPSRDREAATDAAAEATARGGSPDYDTLIDLISASVRPASWPTGTGPGPILPVHLRGIRALAIPQMPDVHEEIEQLLAALRAVARDSAAGEPAEVYRAEEPRPAADGYRVLTELLSSCVQRRMRAWERGNGGGGWPPFRWDSAISADSIRLLHLRGIRALAIPQMPEVHEEIEQLLAALRAVARDTAAGEPAEVYRVGEPRPAGGGPTPNEQIEKRLAERTAGFEYIETPLADVAEWMSARLDVPVQIDRRALEQVGIDTGTPITLRARGMSYRAALRLMLRPMDLTYVVRDEMVLISTPEVLEERLVTRLYPVGDLVPEHQPPGDPLVELLIGIVRPTTWDCVGGPGFIQYVELPNIRVLAVSQEDGVHKEIAELLGLIRRLRRDVAAGKAKTRYDVPGEQPWEARIREALDRPREFDFLEIPLQDVLDELSDRFRINVLLDRRALEQVGIDGATPITFRAKSMSLRAALRLMLREIDLTYLVKDEAILVTTPEQAECELSSAVYPIGDLLSDDAEDEAAREAEAAIVRLIREAVRPTSWDEVGGPGLVGPLPVPGVRALVVSHMAEVHDEIGGLLVALRSAMRDAAAGSLGPRYAAGWDNPREQTIREALDKEGPFEFDGVPLQDVADSIADLYEINVFIDRRALEQVGIDTATPITLPKTQATLRTALERMLREMKLSWLIRHESLWITGSEWAETAWETRLYPVADLVARRTPEGEPWDDYETLEEVVRRCARRPPPSDDAGSADADVCGITAGGVRLLVVVASRPTHEQVEKLLGALRAVAAEHPGDAPPVRRKPIRVISPHPPDEPKGKGGGFF